MSYHLFLGTLIGCLELKGAVLLQICAADSSGAGESQLSGAASASAHSLQEGGGHQGGGCRCFCSQHPTQVREHTKSLGYTTCSEELLGNNELGRDLSYTPHRKTSLGIPTSSEGQASHSTSSYYTIAMLVCKRQ